MPERSRPSKHGNRDDGFALIVVIWVTVLLSIMAAAFTASVKGRIRTTSAKVQAAKVEAAADAGIQIAMLELLARTRDPAVAPRFTQTGTAAACAANDETIVVIEVEDEEGKVNLNTPNEALLLALLSGLGAAPLEARTYADRILDYRDFDHDKRADGAESEDYSKAGRAVGPKDSDFVSVDELDQVLGLPRALVERMKPFVTTLSSQAGVDAEEASKALKAILQKGAAGGFQDDIAFEDPVFGGETLAPQFSAISSRRNYLIRAVARSSSGTNWGATWIGEALVALPLGANGVPAMRQWRRGQGTPGAAGKTYAFPATAPPC